ncbi:MAG: hypothetical protein ACRBFS_08680 [Aureispira sp.]
MLNPTQIEELLRTALAPYEKERRRFSRKIFFQKNWTLISLLISAILPILFIFGPSNKEMDAKDLLTMIFSAIAVFFSVITRYPISHLSKEDFEQKIKIAAFEKVLKSSNSSISYTPNSFLAKELATKTFLKKQLQRSRTQYTGSDYCQGALIDGRAFHFSKILLKEQAEEHTSSGHTITGTRTNFEGLFLVVENSSPFAGFEGRLSLFPREEGKPKKETNLSLQLLQLQENKKLKESNIHNILDAAFNIPTVTVKPFTPKELFNQQYTLMGAPKQKEQLPDSFYQMVGWKELLDCSIYLQFIGKDCYLLLDHLQDFLEVSISHSSLDKSYIQRLAQDFHTVFVFIENIAILTEKH